MVQYVIEAPGSEQALVLTFSTPALGMAEQLRPLDLLDTLPITSLDPRWR